MIWHMDCRFDEKEDGMRRKVHKSMFFIIIFVICFTLTRLVLNKLNVLENIMVQLELQQENADIVNKITSIINGIWSFIVVKIIDILKIFLEHKREVRKGISEISIIINTVTCPRKTRRKNSLLDIDIGKGTHFVYVISTLKNVGARTIVECFINGKKLEINSINVGECLDFCFRVCREETKRYKKSYKINLSFKDDKGVFYEKKLEMRVDEEKQNAEIAIKKKIKRKL